MALTSQASAVKYLLFALRWLLLSWFASQCATGATCTVGAIGGAVDSPPELRSRHGVLKVNLSLWNETDTSGHMQYCYVDGNGNRSPTLRVQPGDLIVLKLKNELLFSADRSVSSHRPTASCSSMLMAPEITNLHFHGLSISPTCHVDDSLRTSILPHSSFVYRFRIPLDQPPGLYWYHPHIQGHSEEQVLGGASGAIIVDGMANATPEIGGLPERLIVIRDQPLKSAGQQVVSFDPSRPSKDLSINFMPVPYPDYPAPVINMRPRTREFWRVLNASADTYVNLAVLFNGEWQRDGLVAVHGQWQRLGVVALDGVPISMETAQGQKIAWKTEIPIPPGGRAEFLFQAPPAGVKAELLTGGVDTTPPQDEDSPAAGTPIGNAPIFDTDDITPPRPLARIIASDSAIEPRPLPTIQQSLSGDKSSSLAAVAPIRTRKFYFSEKVLDPKTPNISTEFYITEEGRVPAKFNPAASTPNVVVRQGDVEDWIIENRSLESHAFHVHQLHFLLLERNGDPVDDQYLLDTIDVPYWDGTSAYPSVRLRMDFRRPQIVGVFPYHCHILQHADRGMMGVIEVHGNSAKAVTDSALNAKAHAN